MLEKLIREEIDEVGEIALTMLIPVYLEHELKRELVYPLGSHKSNFDISERDFERLSRRVHHLVSRGEVGLYEYIPKENSLKWSENFIIVPESRVVGVLSEIQYWLFGKQKVSFFLAFREDEIAE